MKTDQRIIVTIRDGVPVDQALAMVMWAEEQDGFTGVVSTTDNYCIARRENQK